jgi:hypothetical protein
MGDPLPKIGPCAARDRRRGFREKPQIQERNRSDGRDAGTLTISAATTVMEATIAAGVSTGEYLMFLATRRSNL